MKWRQTDHKDGSKSFHLIPENDDETMKLNQAFSTWPGGTKHSTDYTKVRIDVPLLSKDGQTWPDDMGVGDPQLRDGAFTRRVHFSYSKGVK